MPRWLDAGRPVAGRLEVTYQRVKVVDAASEGGDEDHQVTVTAYAHLNLAAVHRYLQRILQ